MKKIVWISIVIVLLTVGILIVVVMEGGQNTTSSADSNSIDEIQLERPTENRLPTGAYLTDSNEDMIDQQTTEGETAISRKNAFEAISKNGYSGTIEEWLASLVGENYPGEADSAYSVAVEKGYLGSYEEWMLTITGFSSTNQSTTAYEVVRNNGRIDSLTAWLNTLVEDPTCLGHATDGSVTEYDRACQNGFQGTFIEWLVSLVGLY